MFTHAKPVWAPLYCNRSGCLLGGETDREFRDYGTQFSIDVKTIGRYKEKWLSLRDTNAHGMYGVCRSSNFVEERREDKRRSWSQIVSSEMMKRKVVYHGPTRFQMFVLESVCLGIGTYHGNLSGRS
ncbi:hypothetical protein EYC80_003771 [Monilinia laxa]|uniref:Uncharacterized protein n=1 Tax=Monilinia laxa TaxID=61186 RepID=A0A5N6KKR2_MONLA|nr:hypothetical protein EYC80_003771 [Monilinia laxa]